MIKETFTFKGSDGAAIFCRKWTPAKRKKIRAIVQIAHGMAEHSARYERFAEALVNAGFAVYANDHRGHGMTAGSVDNLGYFADSGGWDKVVADMKMLTDIIKNNHPGISVFLFGHSMGSFLSRDYIFTYPSGINGVILSGTAGDPGLLGYLGIIISKIEGRIKGREALSPLMDKLSFGSFNNAFKPNRTGFDWLSRDESEVDKYINDPYCGTIFSAGFYHDLVKGIKKINRASNIAKIPKMLPVYIFSGGDDPVGNFSKGVQKVCDAYKKAGIREVGIRIYKGGRHEMLNEINRDEVYKDIIEWLDKHLDRKLL